VLSAFRFARLERMARKHFMSASCAIRGSFFDFVDDPWKHPGHEDRAARFVGDGLLLVRDGIIEDFGNFADLARRHADVPVTHLEDRLILPGFIDGHIHFPQLRILGVFGIQMLEWLQTWIFPEELRYQWLRLYPIALGLGGLGGAWRTAVRLGGPVWPTATSTQ